ncbi:cell divisionFtsK/SpoIIIE [Desulfofarcimen acetoxidans DSM 771]|uniref:Cell divisionFtsK/SpoIIIE n=1 Tax=Desulfofarcimen acetoxidans (strain ATCC 49208 / DSM 771 / KCTC 5769 / VKM B-1644 / 5575) TaxID=485916 RepID=C8VWR8_DESAS|nr:FtsK/SpoIIIE domain-containing protein [Desulfofarcimen acetoxidans]ACV64432.1 cell divisionFtsK/SpoIIIE [Desulfofarcimen acetoxidans DSM 771]
MGRKIEQLKIPLINKTIYLDNKVPGLILDTIDNLNLTAKDGRKPILCGKKRTTNGWHLIFNLPPGISFNRVKRYREYFQDAANGLIDLTWNGALQMTIHTGRLPQRLPYCWEPEEYTKMSLPAPVGVSHGGPVLFNLTDSPHLLIAGVPGFGKSNFLHVLIHSLLSKALVAIIDLKRLEFAYLGSHAALARTEAEALALMESLNREMERRIGILEAAGVVKVQDYQGEDMPYIIAIIDELAELKDDRTMELVDRITRLARAVGISVVAATQRPSTKVLPGDTRAMFQARLCFQVADELNSRMVLGESCPLAAHLPGIKGRAIFKFGIEEKEVQTMFLPLKQAKAILNKNPVRAWNYEYQAKRLLPR